MSANDFAVAIHQRSANEWIVKGIYRLMLDWSDAVAAVVKEHFTEALNAGADGVRLKIAGI